MELGVVPQGEAGALQSHLIFCGSNRCQDLQTRGPHTQGGKLGMERGGVVGFGRK